MNLFIISCFLLSNYQITSEAMNAIKSIIN